MGIPILERTYVFLWGNGEDVANVTETAREYPITSAKTGHMMNKYKAVRSGGFHSKLENSVYQILSLRKKAGEILDIQCQVTVYLTCARVVYIPDFRCVMKDSSVEFYEAKGFEGPRWPTIKKLWKYYGESPLLIYKGSHLRPVLVETIIPVSV